MKFVSKTLVAAITIAALSCTAVLVGCSVSLGADGRDGQDVSIYEIYEATNKARVEEGLEELTFLEFISEYLNYDSQELADMASLQASINRSLLSSVQVAATFPAMVQSGSLPWQQEEGTVTSQGSGVIVVIDKDEGDMYIVTNCHVVFNNSSLNDNKYSDDVDVYLYGREYSTYSSVVNGELQYYIDDTYAIPAQIIGASLNYDIAVLKVDNSDAVKNSSAIAADWSGNESVPVGETVYAIGNAAGSGISATNGIVCVDSEYITLDMYDTTSNYNDDFTYRTIRTSVPIYSGNSGGGLFNIDGDLVGIINSKTTAASSGEYSDNISHALPEANVRRVVQSMIDRYEQTGSTTYGIYRALLGITVEASSPSADMNNDTNTVEKIDNAEITDIQSGSLAEGSLNVGDVITAIKITSSDGTVKEDVEVKRSYNLSEVMLSARSGDCVCITVNRSGQENPISYTFTISDANLSLVG